ncbi:MAG: glycoside hydrolase family 9 protein [Lachnospiraceae bacterium]|nr:glycoside hydrolase family 9 protein [Lachnospiraceae bacterium]
MKKVVTILTIGLAVCLCACSASEQKGLGTDAGLDMTIDEIKDEDTFEEELSPSEESGSKGQRILVDSNGYCPADEKVVYFLGDEEAGIFYVIDAETKEEVYKGAMILTGHQSKDGEAVLTGNFTSVNKEGTYYIEAPYVGRSYTFEVAGDYLQSNYKKIAKAMWTEVESQKAEYIYRVQTLSWLIRYWEYYGDKPETVVVGEFPDYVQKLSEAGEQLILEKPEEMTTEEMAFHCGVMAQLYEVLKPYDVRMANQYLREAEAVYKQLDMKRYEEGFDQVWLFYDSALLYKATGYTRYGTMVKSYLSANSGRDFFADDVTEEELWKDEAYVHGAIAYLNTVFKVDVNLCGTLMEELTDKAESIEKEHDSNLFCCVSANRNNRLLSDRLYVVAMIEHVVVSKEYVLILEDGLHYINGCNELGKSFLTNEGVFDEVNDTKGSGAAVGGAYLFILGEIMESEATE